MVPAILFAEKTTGEILMEAQKVSFKHEAETRFVVSDSLDHYIIYKDDIGQFSVEGVFHGHLVHHEKVDNMVEAYEHYNNTYFVVDNKIYYKDDISDLYSVKVEETPVVRSIERDTSEVKEDGDIPEVKVSNPDEEEEEDDSGWGFSWVTLILAFFLFKFIFD